MKKFFGMVVCAALAFASAQVSAQTLALATSNPSATSAPATTPVAERPKLSVGERWSFDASGPKGAFFFTLAVEEVKPDGKLFMVTHKSNGTAQRMIWSADLNPISSHSLDWSQVLLDHGNSEYALYRFPLYVGKEWKEDYGPWGYRRTITAKVVEHKQQRLEALGDAFELFCVENEILFQSTGRKMQEQYCYSPALRMTVSYLGKENGQTYSGWKLIKHEPALPQVSQR